MEQINFEHSSIDTNYINKLYEQEKQERLGNQKKKCLDTINKIVLSKKIHLIKLTQNKKIIKISSIKYL